MNGTTETGGPADERGWSWWLKIVGALATAPVGIVGCAVTLLVFSRRRSLRQTSFSVYLRAQCVADALVLLQQAFYKLADLVWFASRGGSSLLDWQDAHACRALEMLKRALYMITIWMTMCYCADRFVALRFPLSLRTKTLRSPRTARIVTAVVCVLMPLIECYYFFTMTRSETATAEGRVCAVVADPVLKRVHSIMDNVVHIVLLTAGLPLIAIVVLNVLTVCAIRRQVDGMPMALGATQTAAKVSRKLNQVMLSVSVFYVTCSLPYILVALVGVAYKSKLPPGFWHVLYVADFLSKLFFMSNFVVYSVMRKQFHEELNRVCGCFSRWLRHSTRSSSQQGGTSSSQSASSQKSTSMTVASSGSNKVAEGTSRL